MGAVIVNCSIRSCCDQSRFQQPQKKLLMVWRINLIFVAKSVNHPDEVSVISPDYLGSETM